MLERDPIRLSLRRSWAELDGAEGDLAALSVPEEAELLPARFAVTAFATAAVSVATLAAAELLAVRTRRALPRVRVDPRSAVAAFRSEALFAPIGWERPALWDPIAGDYRAKDRFVRLHTNYASHRQAALDVLGVKADRKDVGEAVATWDGAALAEAVVRAGGAAAAMFTRDEWLAHPHGAATLEEPAIRLFDEGRADPRPIGGTAERPLAGVKVLDLTRVIAGPVCTRFLAAHGASVLRLDPPGFEEVPAVVPDATVGKRCTSLDLRDAATRARFLTLVSEADVLVVGLRPDALDRLGLGLATLREHHRGLVIATLDAYGWHGPWRHRRGFDSLVQMSTGMAADAGEDHPVPLPAQALDHGVGYLLAAGVCRALARRVAEGRAMTVRGALLGAAHHLYALPRPISPIAPVAFPDSVFEHATTAWGATRRVRCPGAIEGQPAPHWTAAAGPIGALPIDDAESLWRDVSG